MTGTKPASPQQSGTPQQAARPLAERSLVLVGLMGAGKSAVGRRLAASLGLSFFDSDEQVEQEAFGMKVADIFAEYGEAEFRRLEQSVLARLLVEQPRCVIATGGGAFMHEGTRALIKAQGISLWLRAELDILLERTSRRDTRPLLRSGDPRAVLEALIQQRYPIYAQADITVLSDDVALTDMTQRCLDALDQYEGQLQP